MESQKAMTAAQRLEGVEASLGMLDQAIGNITMNLQTVINALTLLSNKTEAMVRLGDSGQAITSATVSSELIQINIQDLKEKVEDLKKKGIAVETSEVQDNSFVVGRELDPVTKAVNNDRVQFPLFGLKAEKKLALMGKKVGDIVLLEEGRNFLELTEIYGIVIPSPMPGEESANKEGTSSENEQA